MCYKFCVNKNLNSSLLWHLLGRNFQLQSARRLYLPKIFKKMMRQGHPSHRVFLACASLRVVDGATSINK